jgi:hypothetical protein
VQITIAKDAAATISLGVLGVLSRGEFVVTCPEYHSSLHASDRSRLAHNAQRFQGGMLANECSSPHLWLLRGRAADRALDRSVRSSAQPGRLAAPTLQEVALAFRIVAPLCRVAEQVVS